MANTLFLVGGVSHVPKFFQVPEKDEQDDEHKDANVSWLRSIRGSEAT